MSRLPAVARWVREELYAKQDESCPHCGKWFPLQGAHVHHRKKRSQGGTNDLENLILCPPLCHNDIHLHVARSYELGHMARRFDDPAEVEVRPLLAASRAHLFMSRDGLYCDRCNLPAGNHAHLEAS